MDRTLNFVNVLWERILNPNNATQTHSIFIKLLKNTFLGMSKVRAWPIFTFLMLGQNFKKIRILTYSEIVARGQNL